MIFIGNHNFFTCVAHKIVLAGFWGNCFGLLEFVNTICFETINQQAYSSIAVSHLMGVNHLFFHIIASHVVGIQSSRIPIHILQNRESVGFGTLICDKIRLQTVDWSVGIAHKYFPSFHTITIFVIRSPVRIALETVGVLTIELSTPCALFIIQKHQLREFLA